MEHKTGIEDYYVVKNNKKLAFGYTTGSCAAAAARAAAHTLLTGEQDTSVQLMTPKGIPLCLKIEETITGQGKVCCAVRKFSGDDPDVTDGILIYAQAKKSDSPGIHIDGGEGVGRVTKPGLDQPVGNAAINSVPRRMIAQEVKEVCRSCGYDGGISIVISIPQGQELAGRTFNPRLGIIGGISVLGTSGIVEPMSEAALVESIRIEMQMLAANGAKYLLIAPGNYGTNFIKNTLQLSTDDFMKCSNYVGETVDMALELGMEGILFVSHIGKFIKLAGGIMNTHSRSADARMEILTAHAALAGAPGETLREIMACLSVDEAIPLLQKTGLLEQAMASLAEKIHYHLNHRAYGELEVGAILFSNEYGRLGQTANADSLLKKLRLRAEP